MRVRRSPQEGRWVRGFLAGQEVLVVTRDPGECCMGGAVESASSPGIDEVNLNRVPYFLWPVYVELFCHFLWCGGRNESHVGARL